MKTLYFYFYFSIVHISINYALDGLRFYMHVSNIHVEGTISQIVLWGLSFDFVKKRLIFYLFP